MPRVDGGVRRGTRLSSGLLGGRIWGNKNYYNYNHMSEGIEGKTTYLSTKANVAMGFAVKTASRNANPMAPAPMTR